MFGLGGVFLRKKEGGVYYVTACVHWFLQSVLLLIRKRKKERKKKNVTGDHSSGRNNGTLFRLVSTMWHICDKGNLTVILDRDCDWKML